jgi:ABC-type Mn2+/Zn2+ transport system ATPase subunit
LGGSDILQFLKALHEQQNMTILMISHHLGDVISVVKQICFINQYTKLFEAGARDEMVTAERLTRLYGRPVKVQACEERLDVYVPGHLP